MSKIVKTREKGKWVVYQRRKFLFIPYWYKIFEHKDIKEMRKYVEEYEKGV